MESISSMHPPLPFLQVKSRTTDLLKTKTHNHIFYSCQYDIIFCIIICCTETDFVKGRQMWSETFSSCLREHHHHQEQRKKIIMKSNSAFLSLGFTAQSYVLLMFRLDGWVAARGQERMGVGGNTKPWTQTSIRRTWLNTVCAVMSKVAKWITEKREYKKHSKGFVQLVKRWEQVAARHLSYFPRVGIDWINTRAVLSHCKQGRVPLLGVRHQRGRSQVRLGLTFHSLFCRRLPFSYAQCSRAVGWTSAEIGLWVIGTWWAKPRKKQNKNA